MFEKRGEHGYITPEHVNVTKSGVPIHEIPQDNYTGVGGYTAGIVIWTLNRFVPKDKATNKIKIYTSVHYLPQIGPFVIILTHTETRVPLVWPTIAPPSVVLYIECLDDST